MEYLPRPAYFPTAPVGQVPTTGFQQPLQGFPGFPPGFQPSRYLGLQPGLQGNVHTTPHITPENRRFSLPTDPHHSWRPPLLEVPSESEDGSYYEESDSDEYTEPETPPPHLQAYYHQADDHRGRSRSRSGHHHHHEHGMGHSEHHRRSSLPSAALQHHFNPNGTPFHQPQLLTPFNQTSALPLLFQPQHLPDNQQQAGMHHTHGLPAAQPHGYPPYMLPQPGTMHMPTTPHHPAHALENNFYHAGHAVPQPEVIPMPREDKRRSRSMSKGPANFRGIFPNPKWGKEASRQAIIDPTRVPSSTLKRVTLHPLLAPGCRDLMILNAIRPPATLATTGKYSIQDYFNDPATSPPMNQITLWTGVHENTLTIENAHGVTVANVLGSIGERLFAKLKRPTWEAFTEERRNEIAHWFHHNRTIGRMPPAEKGIRYADLLGPNTMFFGLELCKQLPGMPPGTFALRWRQPI